MSKLCTCFRICLAIICGFHFTVGSSGNSVAFTSVIFSWGILRILHAFQSSCCRILPNLLWLPAKWEREKNCLKILGNQIKHSKLLSTNHSTSTANTLDNRCVWWVIKWSDRKTSTHRPDVRCRWVLCGCLASVHLSRVDTIVWAIFERSAHTPPDTRWHTAQKSTQYAPALRLNGTRPADKCSKLIHVNLQHSDWADLCADILGLEQRLAMTMATMLVSLHSFPAKQRQHLKWLSCAVVAFAFNRFYPNDEHQLLKSNTHAPTSSILWHNLWSEISTSTTWKINDSDQRSIR